MIISASRRTDIPAFYAEWFMQRLRAGFVLVPNPFNARQVQRISLLPQDVDAIFFWTKNPGPLVPHLQEITGTGIPVFVHQTITGYSPEVEPGSPHLPEALRQFRRVSECLGASRVVWRYDPIFFTQQFQEDYHLQAIEGITAALAGCTDRLTLGFVRLYRKTVRNLGRLLGPTEVTAALTRPANLTLEQFVREVVARAAGGGLEVQVCSAEEDLSRTGAWPGACIDAELLLRHGITIPKTKDPGQRAACRCVRSRDIGMYDSCGHGCLYCYANRTPESAAANMRLRHRPEGASLLDFAGSPVFPLAKT